MSTTDCGKYRPVERMTAFLLPALSHFWRVGALVVGGVAGVMFVVVFTLAQHRWKIDDVLGVWPLHGLCGTWGGIAAGIFGLEKLGGMVA